MKIQLPLSTLVLFCTAVCFALLFIVPAYRGYLSVLIGFYLGFFVLTVVIELIQLNKKSEDKT